MRIYVLYNFLKGERIMIERQQEILITINKYIEEEGNQIWV